MSMIDPFDPDFDDYPYHGAPSDLLDVTAADLDDAPVVATIPARRRPGQHPGTTPGRVAGPAANPEGTLRS